MARVTVEDCVERVPNRFELVKLASQRAREISAGATLLLERDDDKNPVVALREIAEVDGEPSRLREALVQSLQRQVDVDEPEDDDLALLPAHQPVPDIDEPQPDVGDAQMPQFQDAEEAVDEDNA